MQKKTAELKIVIYTIDFVKRQFVSFVFLNVEMKYSSWMTDVLMDNSKSYSEMQLEAPH